MQCAGGCGFFGNEAREGYCSQCYQRRQAEKASEASPAKHAANYPMAADSDTFRPPVLEHYCELLLKNKELVIIDFISHWHPLRTHPRTSTSTNPAAHLFTRVTLTGGQKQLGVVLEKVLGGSIFQPTFQKLHLLRRGQFNRDHYLGELTDVRTSDLRVRDVPSVPVLRSVDTLAGNKRPQQAKHLILLGVVPNMAIDDVLADLAEEGLFDQTNDGILPPAIGIHYEQ